MGWDIFRTILGGIIGGFLPLLTSYFAGRRDRGRRLHELYAEFISATYLVYTRFPDIVGAKRTGFEPPDSGMVQLHRSRIRLLMVEKDETRQEQIEAIVTEAGDMLSVQVALERPFPTEEEELERTTKHWSNLLKKCNALVETLKGSLA